MLTQNKDFAIVINLFYLLILLLSVYGIGKEAFNKKVGLMSALIISFYPFIIYLRRNYLLDFSLITLIALSFYLLIKTRLFKNRNYSYLWGSSTALAVLIKPTAIIFLLCPFLYQLYKNWKTKKNKQTYQDSLINLIYAALLFISIVSLWYLPNLQAFTQKVIHYAGGGTSQQLFLRPNPNIFSFNSLFNYCIKMKEEMSLPFFLIFLLGLFKLIKKSKNNLLFFYITFPYLVLSFIPNKDPRYVSPLLIFNSLVSANLIVDLKVNKYFTILVNTLLGFFLILIVCYSLGFNFLTTIKFSYLEPPKQENWQVNEVLQFILKDKNKNNTVKRLLIIPDLPYTNGLTYDYFALKNNLPITVTNAAYINIEEFEHQLLNNFDYVVTKDRSPFGEVYDEIVKEENRVFTEHKKNFKIINFFSLPDGSLLYLYKKNC